jgi:ABC-2 type transport system permease protein
MVIPALRRDSLAADAAWPLQHPVVAALAWIALILAVTAPLAVHRYRTATAG